MNISIECNMMSNHNLADMIIKCQHTTTLNVRIDICDLTNYFQKSFCCV